MTDPVPFDQECFFIAPIGDDGSDIRRRSDGVLDFIVKDAAGELGLHPIRADKIANPGQINLQVIDHVLQAKAAVADLTGLNPNVFYEMAVRHTAKLPLVIIAELGTKLPFDIAQMRTIFFTHTDLRSAAECRAGIVTQLRQAIEGGLVDSPISTAIDVISLSAGNAVDRSVAELVTTVEEMASSQRDLRRAIHESIRIRERRENIPRAAVDDLIVSYERLRRRVEQEGDPGLLDLVEHLEMPVRFIARRSDRPGLRQTSRVSTATRDLQHGDMTAAEIDSLLADSAAESSNGADDAP